MRILYIQPGLGIGGSKVSLASILRCTPNDQDSFVALSKPKSIEYENKIKEHTKGIYYIELPTWQKFKRKSILKKIVAPFSTIKRTLSFIPATIKMVEIIRDEKIDIVHTNNSICPIGAFAAKLLGRPHIWHIREPIGDAGQYPLLFGDAISLFLFKKLSGRIICNSEYTAEIFQKHNIPVSIILNGLNLEKFLSITNNIEHIERPPTIGMVGNLTTRWKNHSLFIDIAAATLRKFPECRFIVFGGSDDLEIDDYTRSLKKKATELGLDKNLFWSAFISNPDIIMESIDILIHPAKTEGSGRVVMEAMASGKPVIAVKSGGVQELIRDGENGFLVTPDNLEEFVTDVDELLSNKNLQKIIGQNAITFAKSHFSEIESAKSIFEIYERLVN